VRLHRGAIVVVGGKKARTVVFEADGDHADQKGIEFRVISPEAGKSGLSATNHFVTRKHDEREAEIAKKRKEEKHYDLPGWLEFSIKRLDALNEAAKAKETDTVDGMFAALKKAEWLARDNTVTTCAYVIEPG